MNKMVFANGQALECLQVEEGPVFYDNANRRALTIHVPKAAGLDAVDAILSDTGSLAKLRHVNWENGAEDVFEHYQIKMELAAKPLPVGEDADGGQVTEERIVFQLGRLTPIEIKLQQLGLL